MPPTMILIGVCACAGAADRSEAEIAAKTAAARILRMGRFLVAAFSCGAGVKCFAGPRVPRGGGGVGGPFGGPGARAPPALSRANRQFGVRACRRQARTGRLGRVGFAMRLVKAQPAEAAR